MKTFILILTVCLNNLNSLAIQVNSKYDQNDEDYDFYSDSGKKTET